MTGHGQASAPEGLAEGGSALGNAVFDLRATLKGRLSILGERISPLQRWETHRADVLIASFPKTGRTWVRMMLHGALSRATGVKPRDPLEFHEFSRADPRVPRIRMCHEDEPHWKEPRELRRSKHYLRHKKVVFLVRDPRDTMTSLYFQMRKRWRATRKPLEEFLWQHRGGIDTLIEYYNLWASNRHVPRDFLLVRYEDLHAAPVRELERLLSFLGVERVGEDAIREAVEANRFDRMRQREASLAIASSRFRPADAADPESFKTRKGKIGGFFEYLEPEQIEALTQRIAERLDPWFRYPVPSPEETRFELARLGKSGG